MESENESLQGELEELERHMSKFRVWAQEAFGKPFSQNPNPLPMTKSMESEKESLRRVFEELEGHMSTFSLWAQEDIRKRFSQNPHLLPMTNNISFTVECLKDRAPETRHLAIKVLEAFYPREIGRFLHDFEILAFDDQDPDVRRNAIGALGTIARGYPPKEQERLGRRIAQVALDASHDTPTRESAYMALCFLSPDFQRRSKGRQEFSFPDGVDWEYVRSWS